MGSNLSAYRRKIASTSSIKEIVEAMSLVAGAKLRKFEKSAGGTEAFDRELHALCKALGPSLKSPISRKLFVENQKAEQSLLIIFTSDIGLCGSYNNNLYRNLNASISPEDRLLIIGRKGESHLKDGYFLAHDIKAMTLEAKGAELSDFTQALTDAFLSGTYKRIRVLHAKYENALTNTYVVETLLPLAEIKSDDDLAIPPLFDGNPEEIFVALLGVFVTSSLKRMQLESLRAEQSSRRNAMDTAKDNADELLKSLNIEYNKARQGAITQEITEVVGGYEAG